MNFKASHFRMIPKHLGKEPLKPATNWVLLNVQSTILLFIFSEQKSIYFQNNLSFFKKIFCGQTGRKDKRQKKVTIWDFVLKCPNDSTSNWESFMKTDYWTGCTKQLSVKHQNLHVSVAHHSFF